MRFHLLEEQVAIQDSVRGTINDVWTLERMHEFAAQDDDLDRESWDALMALGLGGLMVPEADGGAGLSLLDAALVSEVVGETAAPGPIAAHILATALIAKSNTADARAHLPSLVTGETVATLAFGARWLPESWDVTPESGTVRFIPGGRSAQLFVVGMAGGGLALVAAGDGVTVEAIRSSDLTRPLSTLTLSNAKAIPLFEAGDPAIAKAFDAALVLSAADALGGAQRCTDMSVAYAKEREQFGQPIGRFQGLKHQLAHMALDVEPARALVWYAAYAQDAGLADAPRAAAMAKAHLSEVYVRATRAAVAAHGGIGYTWEYGLNYWFRRSLFDRAYLGSPAVHRARAADMAGW